MTKYQPGDRVKIMYGSKPIEATINSITSIQPSKVYYWVDYETDDGRNNCSIFAEEDIDIWQSHRGYYTQCTCGAHVVEVKDNEYERHSWHCDITRSRIKFDAPDDCY